MFTALERVRADGVAVLLVEQNAIRSLALADRAYLIANGRIVGEGAARSLRHDFEVRRAYLGGAGG